MHLVKLTNGTREKPAIYVGLYRSVAAHIFGERASDHNLFRSASTPRFFVAFTLKDQRVVFRAATCLTDAPTGWATAELYIRREGSGDAPVLSFNILPDMIDGLVIEGHCGTSPNPKKVGSRMTHRNKTVAVHGRNEFDHPVNLTKLTQSEKPCVSFSVPSNWLAVSAAKGFQPDLPLTATPREEAAATQVQSLVSAPEPVTLPAADVLSRRAGHYTLQIPADLVEKILIEAVHAGRSIMVEKESGVVLID